EGLLDETLFLPLSAAIDQGRHQHADAVATDFARRLGLGEFFADDVRLQHVGGLLGAAVGLGNAAVEIAGADGLAAEGIDRGFVAGGLPIGLEETLHFAAEGLILLA